MAYIRRLQCNMFDRQFQANLDPTHKLLLLGNRIDWDSITHKLIPYYSHTGRPAKLIRLMFGLLILKHWHDCSDEEAVAQVHENIYWMLFCGVSWRPSDGPPKFLESSSLTRFRKRLGPEGVAMVDEVIKNQLISEKRISSRTQLLDTTAMEKHITYPTDSGLLHRGIGKLVKVIRKIQKLGVASERKVRSFKRLSKKAIVEIHKLGKGRKGRIEENTKRLARYAKEVVKEVPHIVKACQEHLRKKKERILQKKTKIIQRSASALQEQTQILKKVIHQAEERFKENHVKEKIYSLHEPHVACIRKGKRGKPDEYGSKVLFNADRNGYIVSHREYFSNPNDSELLEDAIKDWERTCGMSPVEVGADRGFHRPSYEGKALKKVLRWSVPRKGKERHPESDRFWFKRLQRRRASLEPLIGHLKTDHRMNRCRYKGPEGDMINVSLVSMAWNLKKWGKVLSPV